MTSEERGKVYACLVMGQSFVDANSSPRVRAVFDEARAILDREPVERPVAVSIGCHLAFWGGVAMVMVALAASCVALWRLV